MKTIEVLHWQTRNVSKRIYQSYLEEKQKTLFNFNM